ncbi:unnamed protein product, partial [Strongylus vulgaris]
DKKVTGLPATVKSAKNYASRYLSENVNAPNAKTVTSADNFVDDAAVYIIAGDDWTSMQSLAETVLSKLGNKYTAVITATEAVSATLQRDKRVTTSDMEQNDANPSGTPGNAGPDLDLPVTLPPYNRTSYPDVKPGLPDLGSCMLYLEGVNIVVQNGKQFVSVPVRSLTNTTSWSYADGDVKCNNATNGTYSFTVRLKLKGDVMDDKQRVKITSGSQIQFK